MASFVSTLLFQVVLVVSLLHFSNAGRILTGSVEDQSMLFQYHNGPLLSGKISVNLIWYGNFKPAQRAIISDFISSLTSSSQASLKPQPQQRPPFLTWWKITDKYYHLSSKNKKPSSLSLQMGNQILDENYSLGKSLTRNQILQLAAGGDHRNVVNVVL
ncbi:protein EXORDIUM-like, partial [Macadamia integrifolia]|uniref:protein EXORDIUM-like n=1 Tax=Macadamia integrifolia TaxID=60698 RepID=UPI001C4F5F1D